ncbi:hypothetical protein PG996_005868 [Apiospora saccharicola]|uniref:Peptidase A2 domain-containing protein n=1 Tax=Apiospora saccharicola TaxID=335842 RepID=A0ABR1VMN3_9PEZI
MVNIPTQSWVRLTPAGDDSECIVADPSVYNLGDFPVRVEACSKHGDNSLWRFESLPDNPDDYTIYNKAFTDSLQLIFQVGGPYKIAKMAQKRKGDLYRIWMISTGDDPNTIQIRHSLWPGLPLHQETINSTNAVIICDQYEGWSVAKMEDVKSQSPASFVDSSAGSSHPTASISTSASSLSSSSPTFLPTDIQSSGSSSAKDESDSSNRPLTIGLSVGLSAIFLLIIAGMYCWYRKRGQKEDQGSLPEAGLKFGSGSPSTSRSVSVVETSRQHDPEMFQTQLRIKDKADVEQKYTALLDTGCQAGDLISSRVVEELKMLCKIRELSKAPTWSDVNGQIVSFSGEITLAWKIHNSTRSFIPTKFFVMDSPDFEIILEQKDKQHEDEQKRKEESNAANERESERKKKSKDKSHSGDTHPNSSRYT